MFSPDQQGSVFIERFGSADDNSVGYSDRYSLTEGAAAPHPLVANLMKITSTETAIRGVQLGEDGGREIGAIKGAPPSMRSDVAMARNSSGISSVSKLTSIPMPSTTCRMWSSSAPSSSKCRPPFGCRRRCHWAT